jgi:ABC-2 type transport system ATP-binding protein
VRCRLLRCAGVVGDNGSWGDDAPIVQLHALSKRYGRHEALIGISLRLRRGEVFGYLGPNGAGKTTTLRILMGFLRPSAGAASVFGLDSWRSASIIHREVGYVAGEFALYPRLTGAEMLEYLGHLRGGVDLEYVRLLAKRLDADLSRPLRTLSKGNRQKVAIVQALMCHPRLLVLDEPTTGLDPLVQQQVHEMLREHVGAGGTVLLSSHVLSEVQLVADRVGIIRAGKLIAVEQLDDLRRKSLHHVHVTFNQPVAASEFVMNGVHDIAVTGNTLTCSSTQDAIDPLLRVIVRRPVVDLACEEASLDETFLAYYASGGSDAA